MIPVILQVPVSLAVTRAVLSQASAAPMLLQLAVNPLRVPLLQHKIAKILGPARTAPHTHTPLCQPHMTPLTHTAPSQPHSAPLTHTALSQPHTNPATHTAPCPQRCPGHRMTEREEVVKQGMYRAVAQGNSHRSKKGKCCSSLTRARLLLSSMNQHRWTQGPSCLAQTQRRSRMRALPVVVAVALQCASPASWTSLIPVPAN